MPSPKLQTVSAILVRVSISAKIRIFKTDYSKDVVEVYRDLVKFLIRKSPRVLDVLSHVQHNDDPAKSLFPS